MADQDKQPFLGHLEELRKRLITSAIAVGIGFVIAYFFSDRLFHILASPLKQAMGDEDKLIFTGLPDVFLTYLKISFIAGVLAAAPVIFYELWMFIAPGLYRNEKTYVIPFVLSSTILFVGGALFGYFVVFPFGFKFFLGFSSEYIQALPSVKEFFSFSIKLLFAFGLVFELPVVVFFLAKMDLVTPEFLKRKRKYALLLTFVAACILTPPDVITQFFMAGPLILLYEISIVVAKTARRKKAAKEDTAEAGVS